MQIENIKQIVEIINELNKTDIIDIKKGIAKRILLKESFSEKLKFLIYLQGAVYLYEEISDEQKLILMSLFTMFIHFVIDSEE